MPILPPQDREVVFVQFTVIEIFIGAIDEANPVVKMLRCELSIGRMPCKARAWRQWCDRFTSSGLILVSKFS